MKTTINNDSKGPSLTERMKAYETAYTSHLTRRMPVIIRLDGKAFKNWTHTNLNRPFDDRLPELMSETIKYLMKEIQGCVFAFSQSDEISLFLRDYDSLNTESWFGSNLQKMISVSSSLATAKFNQEAYRHRFSLAHFDSRVFILPKEEVVNYFIYRQHDGVRNSISMLANSIFGHKKIHGISSNDMKQMLIDDGHPWEELKPMFRHGIYMKKNEDITLDVPLFKDNRSIIEELVYVKPE